MSRPPAQNPYFTKRMMEMLVRQAARQSRVFNAPDVIDILQGHNAIDFRKLHIQLIATNRVTDSAFYYLQAQVEKLQTKFMQLYHVNLTPITNYDIIDDPELFNAYLAAYEMNKLLANRPMLQQHSVQSLLTELILLEAINREIRAVFNTTLQRQHKQRPPKRALSKSPKLRQKQKSASS